MANPGLRVTIGTGCDFSRWRHRHASKVGVTIIYQSCLRCLLLTVIFDHPWEWLCPWMSSLTSKRIRSVLHPVFSGCPTSAFVDCFTFVDGLPMAEAFQKRYRLNHAKGYHCSETGRVTPLHGNWTRLHDVETARKRLDQAACLLERASLGEGVRGSLGYRVVDTSLEHSPTTGTVVSE
ncbi:hypothetical protein BDV18DRAFT_22761 [Aspergillus unguis]